MPPARVALYENLFFHVRDRLGCEAWVRNVVLAEAGRPTVAGAVRAGGFYRGPLALDPVLAAARDRRPPAGPRPQTVADWDAITV